MFRSGCATWTMVLSIIRGWAINNKSEAALHCKRLKLSIQFVFTEETAIRRVRAVARIFKFFGEDDFVSEAEALSDSFAFCSLVFGEAGGVSRDTKTTILEFSVRNVSDVAAVHSTWESYDYGTHLPKQPSEIFFLL